MADFELVDSISMNNILHYSCFWYFNVFL